jgi:small-conductance mechanosensitive channel/CRP-like cAMP-binding protein
MTSLLTSTDIIWVAILVILLPVLIVGAGEVQERLRQRGSSLEKPVATFRNWVLPLAAVWILVVLIFDVAETTILSRAIATAALIAAAAAILQVIRYFTDEARARSRVPGTRHVPQLFLMVPRLVVLLVAGWLLFTTVWNVDLTGLFAALGVTSLVVSLALQSTLSGLASGFLLLSDKPFEPGDWIKANDVEGQVVDTNWRSSRIRDRNGDLVVIPNSVLAGATLVNFDQPARLHRVVVSLQVAYANPPTNAVEMLLAAARATNGVLTDPSPVVRVVQIDDPLMGYDVHMWIDDYTISPRVKSDFGALVWYQSHRMDVPLPSPAFDLYHHDPIQEAADAALTVDQLAERVRLSSVFSELDDTDIRELAVSAVAQRFRRGETILAAGVASREVYVLWSGRARIMIPDEPNVFIELSDGDVFGVVSRSRERATSQQVVAVADCEVVRIEASTAGAVASRNPSLADELNQLMSSRNRRLDPHAGRIEIEAPVPDSGSGEVDEALVVPVVDAGDAGSDEESPS